MHCAVLEIQSKVNRQGIKIRILESLESIELVRSCIFELLIKLKRLAYR